MADPSDLSDRVCCNNYRIIAGEYFMKLAADHQPILQIRSKRLAKLSGQSSTSSASGSQTASANHSENGDDSEPQHQSNEQASQSQQQQRTHTEKPQETSSDTADNSSPVPRITVRPSAPTQNADTGSPKPLKTASSRPTETIEQFTDKLLRSTFRFSLKQDERSDHNGSLIYLSDIREELDSENEAPVLSLELLDQAFLFALTNGPQRTPSEYLIPCWRRINRQYKQYKRLDGDDPKFHVLEEARRVCLCYCHIAFAMPEIIDIPSETGIELLKLHLLMSPDDDLALDHDFLMESGKRAATGEDTEIVPAYVAAVVLIYKEVANMNIDGAYNDHMRVCSSGITVGNPAGFLISYILTGTAQLSADPSNSKCYCALSRFLIF